MSASTWFITGTSTGFGRVLTEQLLARGHRVAATLRRPEQLDDLAARYGEQLWVRRLDVTDTAQLRAVVDAAFAELGRIDVVVSNAGYGVLGATEEFTDEQLTRQLDTNLLGSIQLARAALPHLRAQGGGHLVQLSSMGGQMAFAGSSPYHASKWGIEGFYESLAPEIAPFGIRTTLVEPGGTATEFIGAGMAVTEELPAYADGPVAQLRALLSGDSGYEFGDPAHYAETIIEAVASPEPPTRLLLGADAYEQVTTALAARLAQAEAQRETAVRKPAATGR
ncbi:SDR family oxidoreductase [Crossiella cryophila]|uniref:NAD(P)-dependent dehydrogenase (Short-subunit alcohol dehydrogenase family) n=1 Tax=Crossiella cryophila TaxID=43355 RepID=A0A7W7CDV1_9PSEU|nr:SDR family oxidoreductase [Crossiella cryophila]MBB4679305.1 NAD(P)-dependent dehydrogenase (short-subunit alcohol dehydrogenase family) [Crossiella cryophila]